MRKTTATVVVCSLLTAAAVAVSASPASAAFPGNNGRIVFTSLRDGNLEIYSMNPDGSDQQRLTNDPGADIQPSYSPDGSKIVFASSRDGNYEIYVMNADGSTESRLTTDPNADIAPSYSPDGTKIVFQAARTGNFEVFVMNADGSAPVNLSNNPSSDMSPAWSPGGTKIAFASTRTGNYEVFAMNTDGSGQVNLTNSPASDDLPSWAPGGSKIAFQSSRDGNLEIYSMNADGSAQTRLTTAPAADITPAWSPDGARIAFASTRSGDPEIWAINADGTAPTQVTTTPGFDYQPNWQPLPVPDTIVRLAGPTRIGTAIAVSADDFGPDAAGKVVLARSDNYPDALAAAPLARAVNGPVLLTATAGLDPATAAEIQRVLPPGAQVILLGGTAALSDTVKTDIEALGFTVVRYAGPTRYDTAAQIADNVPGAANAYLATGLDFPNALVAGSVAATTNGVVLLTEGTTLPTATSAWLAAHPAVSVKAVGAPAAAAAPTATALVGADAYDTSRVVAQLAAYAATTSVSLASGVTFPDGLTGGAHAARNGAPLLLVPATGTVTPSVRGYLLAKAGQITGGYLYGGTAAVSSSVLDDAIAAINGA